MITTIVQFRLPEAITLDQAREIFLTTAPKYVGVAGLIRKQYLVAADGYSAGGVYLWKTREDAERLFTADWHEFIRGKYGSEPSIAWLNSPVIVDNVACTIITDEER